MGWTELFATLWIAQSAAPAGGGLQLVGARCCSLLAANYYRPRANSAIQRIAVLGESDALAARGGRAEDEWAVLLRFVEPPGLRAGPLAHPERARPELERIGHCQTSRTPGRNATNVVSLRASRGGRRPARAVLRTARFQSK